MPERSDDSKRSTKRRCDPRVALVCRKIENELSKPATSVDQLAWSVKLSARHLERLFQQELGMTVRQYQIEKKLQKAVELLKENPSALVTKISYQLGFQDPSYFARVFKRRLGLSPKEYQLARAF